MNNKVGFLKSTEEVVESFEPCRNTTQFPFVAMQFINTIKRTSQARSEVGRMTV